MEGAGQGQVEKLTVPGFFLTSKSASCIQNANFAKKNEKNKKNSFCAQATVLDVLPDTEVDHTSYLSILVHRRIIEVYKKYTS